MIQRENETFKKLQILEILNVFENLGKVWLLEMVLWFPDLNIWDVW